MFESSRFNFDRRRAVEWKLSFTLWAAIAAFITLMLRHGATLDMARVFLALKDGLSWSAFLFIVLAVIIVTHHYYSMYRIGLANQLDHRNAELYEEMINDELESWFLADPHPDAESIVAK